MCGSGLPAEMKKSVPEDELVEIPWEHPIFNQKYKFSQGLPKIHEHDAKRPQALGIVKEGRLVVLLLSKPTWEMAGKTLKCTMILKTAAGSLADGGEYYFLCVFQLKKG